MPSNVWDNILAILNDPVYGRIIIAAVIILIDLIFTRVVNLCQSPGTEQLSDKDNGH